MDALAAEPGFAAGDLFALGYAIAGVILFAGIAVLSHEADRPFSAAMAYLGIGVAVAAGADAAGIELIDPVADVRVIEHLSEFAVIVALFSTGLKIDRRLGWREWQSTVRLLAIAMPLTIAAVALFGVAAMGLPLGAAILLGAILAPTDPVLASDVAVGPPGEDDEGEPQFALSSEAGFNDGLALPFVFLAVFILGEGGTAWLGEWLIADVLYGISAGVLIGAAGGWAIAAATLRLRATGWLDERLDAWLALAAVLSLYGITELTGAYGFLAAFSGGLAFRRYEHTHERNVTVHSGAEMIEDVTEILLVLLLGSLVTLAGLAEAGWGGAALVVVLLVVIRPLSALLALVRTPLPARERAFIGWFGIRGIGSLYYLAVALQADVLAEGDRQVIVSTVLAVTAISILAHGLSSSPVTRRLARAEGS